MADIRRITQRIERDNGGIDLVIIDYLQLMQASSGTRVESRQLEVAGLSRGAKILAKDLGVPVIALSQLNRSSEARVDKNLHSATYATRARLNKIAASFY